MKNVGAKLLLLVTIAVAVLVMGSSRGNKAASTSLTVPAAVREKQTKGRGSEVEKAGKQPSEVKRGLRGSEADGSPAAVSMEERRFYMATVVAMF